MKAKLSLSLAAVVLSTLIVSDASIGAQNQKDPTKYDCRVVVGYKVLPYSGNKPPRSEPIWECPDKDKMAAGQCETDIWGRMYCKN